MASSDSRDSYSFSRPLLPTVAIVGRPNVGKSALFNRIVGRRQAIVHEASGVTRDRVTAVADYGRRRFMLVDTGGLGIRRNEKATDPFDGMIRRQLEVALETADRIILVVDARLGVMAQDEEVAELLRPMADRVVVAVNKSDTTEIGDTGVVFRTLGFRNVLPVSAMQNRGIDALLEASVGQLPTETQYVSAANDESGEHEEHASFDFSTDAPAVDADDPDAPDQPRVNAGGRRSLQIAIVGRPNVGKSSLVNRLLGEDRVLVSDVAGTTRDAVDIPVVLNVDGREVPVTLIDTAGIRRRGKVKGAVDYFSMARSEKAIIRADVVLLVLDATNPATMQDKKICRMVVDAGKPCLLLLNKWDLASQEIKQKDLFTTLAETLPFMSWARVHTCCAVSGYNFKAIVPEVLDLAAQLDVKIPTALLNQVIHDAMERVPAAVTGKGRFKVFYSVHAGNRPPKFVLFCNRKSNSRANYLGYLEGQLRRAFGLVGLPLTLELRERKSDPERAKTHGFKPAAPGNPDQRPTRTGAKPRQSRADAKKYRRK